MSLLASWLASPPPDAAVEIAPERVSAATLRGAAGTSLAVQAYAVEPLPPGPRSRVARRRTTSSTARR